MAAVEGIQLLISGQDLGLPLNGLILVTTQNLSLINGWFGLLFSVVYLNDLDNHLFCCSTKKNICNIIIR